MTDTHIRPNAQSAAILAELQQLTGAKNITQDADDMAPWLVDWRGRYHGAALALVSPETTEQLAALVRFCAAQKIAIVPQGGNSGMVGGATPDASGHSILLSLRKMNRIEAIDAEAGLVTAQSGVILQNLHEAVLREGQRFPLSLGGKGSATVGGLISTNAGGTQVLRHGNMRALVAGLEAVLPDGSIFNCMSALKKDNRGYALKELFVGAEGTIGIVTRALLHTVPALIDRQVAWVGLNSPTAAYKLLQYMQSQAEAELEGFEILPHSCLQSVLTHIEGTRAPLNERHPWYALIELVKDRPSQEDPAELTTRLLSGAMEAGLVDDVTLAANETQAEKFWKLRETISEAERAEGPAKQHDISVPVSQMAAFIEQESLIIEAKWAGTRVAAFGHLGDGNVHFHVKAPTTADTEKWAHEDGKAISHYVYDAVTRWGGSISAEHGIGQDKRDELVRQSDPVRMKMLRAVKEAFDPDNIMNPGKLVSLASTQNAP